MLLQLLKHGKRERAAFVGERQSEPGGLDSNLGHGRLRQLQILAPCVASSQPLDLTSSSFGMLWLRTKHPGEGPTGPPVQPRHPELLLPEPHGPALPSTSLPH